MVRRRQYPLAALLLLLCTLCAGPALFAVGPDPLSPSGQSVQGTSDGTPTLSVATGDGDPTGTTEHSPDMDPDGLVAAAPDADAGTLFDWIERILAMFVGGIV